MPLPYKTLVLCFDGTWNDLRSRTNVSRLYSEIADVSTGCTNQVKFYDEGVGTGQWDRIRGGAFGMGLEENIRAGYAWLASVYQCETDRDVAGNALIEPPAATPTRKPNGDLHGAVQHSSGKPFLAGSDVYIVGFSRGAYTARSLGGLVNYLGIPRIDPGTLEKEEAPSKHPCIAEAWELYVNRPAHASRKRIRDGKASQQEIEQVAQHDELAAAFRDRPEVRYPVRIHFMGVWDTVGALGVPPVFGVWNNPLNAKYRFHDTTLGESTRHAYHAVAIDEHRLPYAATLWTAARRSTESIEQRWFPGAHANIGGGYPVDLLHELPLIWLARKAASCGLEFMNDRHIPAADGTVPASIAMAPASFDLDGTEHLSPVNDSYSEFLRGVYKLLRWFRGGRMYRRVLVPTDGIAQKIDESAFEKWRVDAHYRPPNLAQAGRAEVSYPIASLDAGIDWGQP